MWGWVPERILGGVLAVDSIEIGRAGGRCDFSDIVSYVFKIREYGCKGNRRREGNASKQLRFIRRTCLLAKLTVMTGV